MRCAFLTLISARSRIVALALIAPLMLASCGSSDAENTPVTEDTSTQEDANQGEDPATAEGANAGAAELSMAGQSFSFDLASCVINDPDIVAHGPGREGDSDEPAYLEMDVVYEPGASTGGATITLGATDMFSEGEGSYILSIDAGHNHMLAFDGEQAQLTGDFHVDGYENIGQGTLTLACH